ncbi:MMPL family transporter [bacterium 210820-DFI.6.37]|nr:MMPL family transporter [bacterium 210820-DFI.6.37]
MNRLSGFVIKRKKAILVFFGIFMLIGLVLFFCTPINYNILDYLPPHANSTAALEKMEEEFQQPIPNLNVMAEDVELAEARVIKEKIEQADYVTQVIWLDDFADLRKPIEIQESAGIESYYKDGKALYMVTVQDGHEPEGIEAVRKAVRTRCKISGTAADQANAQQTAMGEAAKAMALLIPILIIILLLSTESWIEPFFYLTTLGASVVINLGSNIFFGEISFVTLAAAPILQLAVSLDYAVFLSHSFSEYKSHGMAPVEAIRMAILSANKSILASMLTTFFGFLALLFMEFRIGADMGISLVKGVVLSYICVMTLLPALLLCGSGLIDKTKHRRLMPSFGGMGKQIVKLRIPFAAVLLVIAIPMMLAQGNNNFFYGVQEETPVGSEGYEVEREFGLNNSLVLMVPSGDSARETQLCADLEKIQGVSSVTSYVTMVSGKVPKAYLADSIAEQFYSEDYARILLSVDCPYEGDDAFRLVEQVRAAADDYYPGEYYTCGQSANMYDMKQVVERDNRVVGIITVISIYLVLAVMTRNWLTPLILILTIKCSIWVNMGIPYFAGNSLCYLGYLIISTVQMGATVDYAILLTNTYQGKRTLMDARAAMKETLGEVFSSILVSAVTLTLSGLCLKWASSNEIVSTVGVLCARGAVLAVIMVMLLLPALLLAADKIIPRAGLRVPWSRKDRKEQIS